MKVILLSGLVGMIFLAASPADAAIRHYRPAKVQFQLPSGWNYQQGANGVLTVGPKDGTLAIVFSMMSLTNIDKALKHARKSLRQNIKHVRLRKAKPARMGGMPGYFLRGKGKLANGAKVEFGLVVLISPTRRAMMVMALGALGKYEKHARMMKRCLASIKPRGGVNAAPNAAASLRRIAKRLLDAVKRRKPLARFMSKRVRLTYETSDRAEPSFHGRGTFSATALNGKVRVRGKAGKRRATKTLDLRRDTRSILSDAGSTAVNVKTMTYEISAAAPTATFYFRWEGRGARRRLVIFKVAYSVHDPG